MTPRLIAATLVVACATFFVAPAVHAQAPSVLGGAVFARTSDGALFMVQNGTRTPLQIVPWDDAKILALPESTPETWLTTASFSGTGDMVTPPFSVGRRWRLAYTVVPRSPTITQLCVSAAALDASQPKPSFGCFKQPAGESYAYTPGTFYLDIGGVNGGWTVQVQELQS